MVDYERTDDPARFDPDADVDDLIDDLRDEEVWVESGPAYGPGVAADRLGVDIEVTTSQYGDHPPETPRRGGPIEFERVTVAHGGSESDETYEFRKRAADCLGLDADALDDPEDANLEDAKVGYREHTDDVNLVTSVGELLDGDDVEAVELQRGREVATVDLETETVGYFETDRPTYSPGDGDPDGRTDVRLVYGVGRVDEFALDEPEPAVSPPLPNAEERESRAIATRRLAELRGEREREGGRESDERSRA